MKEKDFITIINNSIKAYGGFSYKIPDIPTSWMKDNPMRFTGKKPFDIVSELDGNVFFIEVKFCRGICGFSERILRPHQIENLSNIEYNRKGQRNIFSLVMYCCYIPRKIKNIYIFDIEYILKNKITKKELENKYCFLPVKSQEYIKQDKKTGEKKVVRENIFNAKKIKDFVIR